MILSTVFIAHYVGSHPLRGTPQVTAIAIFESDPFNNVTETFSTLS